MSYSLPILLGLTLGVSALSLYGWPLVLFLAGCLFATELLHDVREMRGVGE